MPDYYIDGINQNLPGVDYIPFLNLSHQHERLREAMKNAFLRVYDRNWFILGKEVEGFESDFASYIGTTHCIGTGNGLDALVIALQACGIGRGQEVIVPAHTYLATWLAVTRCGATPVPVDADPVTFNIDTSRIEEQIRPATRAILPVHLYGQSCNMTRIDELSRQYHLYVVEDNAQAHGAKWLEKRTGSFGHINATSFYPTKNLGALGDGGAITTFEARLDTVARRLRNYGLKEKNIAQDQGLNSRLDEIQAAMLRVKLLYLDEWNDERRRLAKLYLSALRDTGDLRLPLSDKEAHHVYHLFVIQTDRRNALREYLATRGVETLVHYPVSPHLQDAFSDYGFHRGQFPVAESIAATALSLPLWPGMTDSQVEHICGLVRSFFGS